MASSLEELRDWPQATVMKLFELVKPHSILYNPKHEHWSNTIEKGRIWTRIAKELDPLLSSKKCRDRFHSNKRKYINELRKQMARGDQDVNYDFIWLLDPHEEDKENDGKMAGDNNDHENDGESGIHSHESDEEPTTSANQDVPMSVTLMDIINQFPPADSSDGEGEPSLKRRKRKNSDPQKVEPTEGQLEPFQAVVPAPSNNNNFIMNFMASWQNFQTQQQEQVEQECSVFGRQVEIDLHRLNAANRAKARLAITGILSQIYQEQQRNG